MTKEERKFVWIVVAVALSLLVTGAGMIADNDILKLVGAFSAAPVHGNREGNHEQNGGIEKKIRI